MKKKQSPSQESKDSLFTGNSDVVHISNYFHNILLEIQENLSQLTQYTKSLADANESLARLVVKDGLTGLYNNTYIKERLLQEIYRAERYKHSLSLLMIDLDDFKAFNDEYGHVEGDKALKGIADIIKESFRPSDISARYGGEEFLVILPETGQENAFLVSERIRERVASYAFEINSSKEKPGFITVSIGLCTFPKSKGSAEDLIIAADNALYKAKKEGKNKVVICDASR